MPVEGYIRFVALYVPLISWRECVTYIYVDLRCNQFHLVAIVANTHIRMLL